MIGAATLGKFLLVAAAIYLLLLLSVFLFQRSLIYFPDRSSAFPAELGLFGFERERIAGKPATGSWWSPPKSEQNPVLILFHGNGGGLAGRAQSYAMLARDGAGVLAVGYPGYNGDPGQVSEQSLYETARANYDWLVGRGIAPGRIVIIGQSLGTGPATWLASETEAAGLILEAPFTSIADMASWQFSWLPVRWLLKDRYPNIERIAAIEMPLSWIYGRRDTLIPVEMGQRLFDAAKEPKCAQLIAEADHNDLWMHGIDRIILDTAQAMTAQASCEQSTRSRNRASQSDFL